MTQHVWRSWPILGAFCIQLTAFLPSLALAAPHEALPRGTACTCFSSQPQTGHLETDLFSVEDLRCEQEQEGRLVPTKIPRRFEMTGAYRPTVVYLSPIAHDFPLSLVFHPLKLSSTSSSDDPSSC